MGRDEEKIMQEKDGKNEEKMSAREGWKEMKRK